MVLVALKLKHHVDHVLEHLGPREAAFFGNMTNQGNGHMPCLGVAKKLRCRLAYLTHASCGGIQLGVVGRLDGINNQERRLELLGSLQNL